jgi:hypothetical protein
MDVPTKKVKKLAGKMELEPFIALLNIIYFRIGVVRFENLIYWFSSSYNF